MTTNKPVAIAIQKSLEYRSLVVGNVCRHFRRRITGASFQKQSHVPTKHQATTKKKCVAIASHEEHEQNASMSSLRLDGGIGSIKAGGSSGSERGWM